jgi:two-component system, NarL family, invasion response regulator UvrY
VIEILIVDDHRLVREGLKKILAETPNISVADEASGGLEALRKVRQRDFDVIILDISMPGKSGIEVLEELKKEKPKSHILILSMHPEEQYAVRALKAGAAGYLTKESASNELIDAIHRISAGKKFITASLAENLAVALEADAPKAPHELLSNREFQILCMIARGKSIKDIASELFLSVKTVSTYRTRILDKMRMKNTSELIYYAIKNGLIA